MALNAYIPQDSGNLKYVAEDEQATPEQLAEFLEALQEALTGKSKDGPFVIIDIDAGFSAYVEFADEEVTEVRRVLKIGGVPVDVTGADNGASAAEEAPRQRRKPGPKPGSTRRKPGPKPGSKRVNKRAAAAEAPATEARKPIKSGGAFKRRDTGDE